MNKKTCTKCKQEKDLEDFPPAKQVKDGRSSWCRRCSTNASLSSMKKKPDYYLKKGNEWKSKNRDKTSIFFKTWYYKNRDKVLERKERYRKSEHGKAVEKRYNTNYLKENKDIIRTKHRLKYKTDPLEAERCKTATRKRRDLKKVLDFNWTIENSQDLYTKFDNKCFKCNKIDDLTIDHFYPLSKGNGLIVSNAVLLCRGCNASKSNKNPLQFFTISELERLMILGINTTVISLS